MKLSAQFALCMTSTSEHLLTLFLGSDHFSFSALFKFVGLQHHSLVFCNLHDVEQAGKDDRFDPFRDNKWKFFTFWHVQALWAFVTTMPVHVCNFFRGQPQAWNAVDSIGLALWALGFAVEVIADQQKSTFRKQHRDSKDSKWICSGLWA